MQISCIYNIQGKFFISCVLK